MSSTVVALAQMAGDRPQSHDVALHRELDVHRIAWLVHDFTWWPSALLVVTPAGRIEGRYVNAGLLLAANEVETGAGPRILAGGISNSRSAAMMAVLDAGTPSGVSPEEPGSRYACDDCPEGSPEAYFLFPPSHVSRATGQPYNQTAAIEVVREQVKVTTEEGGSNVHWVYSFSRDLELLSVTPSDRYWVEHERLSREGIIDHPISARPEARPAPIPVWRPSAGWTVAHLAGGGSE